jgi:hypothetical protein
MEKDAIRNQKVFISLAGVLALQQKIRQAELDCGRDPIKPFERGYRNGLQLAASLLDLPIEFHNEGAL